MTSPFDSGIGTQCDLGIQPGWRSQTQASNRHRRPASDHRGRCPRTVSYHALREDLGDALAQVPSLCELCTRMSRSPTHIDCESYVSIKRVTSSTKLMVPHCLSTKSSPTSSESSELVDVEMHLMHFGHFGLTAPFILYNYDRRNVRG